MAKALAANRSGHIKAAKLIPSLAVETRNADNKASQAISLARLCVRSFG